MEGRTYQSLSDEFGLTPCVVTRIVTKYKKSAKENAARAKEIADMKELDRLRQENEELKKEVDLKKAAAFFAKEGK